MSYFILGGGKKSYHNNNMVERHVRGINKQHKGYSNVCKLVVHE